MEHKQEFDQWALVELMGHQRIAGRVTEAEIGGSKFIHADELRAADLRLGDAAGDALVAHQFHQRPLVKLLLVLHAFGPLFAASRGRGYAAGFRSSNRISIVFDSGKYSRARCS